METSTPTILVRSLCQVRSPRLIGVRRSNYAPPGLCSRLITLLFSVDLDDISNLGNSTSEVPPTSHTHPRRSHCWPKRYKASLGIEAFVHRHLGMKKLWKTDSSDRLSLAVLAFCLLMLAGVL